MAILGQQFNWRHAAGVTRFQVVRRHRDAGYYECVAVRGVEGTHHFLGGIQVVSQSDIVFMLGLGKCQPDEAGWCRNEFCNIHGALDPTDVQDEETQEQVEMGRLNAAARRLGHR